MVQLEVSMKQFSLYADEPEAANRVANPDCNSGISMLDNVERFEMLKNTLYLHKEIVQIGRI